MKPKVWALAFIEQFANTSLGLVIGAFFLAFVINPLFSLSLTMIANLEISLIMFSVSLVRGTVLRIIYFYFTPRQNFKHSTIEKIIDVGLGFIISLIVWSMFVMPAYDVDNTLLVDIIINLLFFIVNFARSLIVRRVFEKYLFRQLTTS